MVSVYQAGDETLRLVPTDAPDISVRLSDGTLYQLYEFTAAVLEYWRDFLRSEGIRVRRQTVAELLGHPR